MVVIPAENEKDLKEVPQEILKDLKIFPVEHMDEVLKYALNVEDVSKIFRNPDADYVLEDLYAKQPLSKGEEPTEILAH